MVLVGYKKEQHVFFVNFKYFTILLKRGVMVALNIIFCGLFLPSPPPRSLMVHSLRKVSPSKSFAPRKTTKTLMNNLRKVLLKVLWGL